MEVIPTSEGRLRPLAVQRLGVIGYGEALALQQMRHAEVAAGLADDTLFLLQHRPVITQGRHGSTANLLADCDALGAAGIEFFSTDRGGDVTYHGPGQLVGYPILRLGEEERDVRGYIERLEEILIRACAEFNVGAKRVDGLRGVWVSDAKIGAVGVRIADWVTMHGFALNVTTDLRAFDNIVPCGIADRGVTSLARELGAKTPAMAQVEAAIVRHAAAIFGRRANERPMAQEHAEGAAA
jgi:lipoyl(octanoyl) transferase